MPTQEQIVKMKENSRKGWVLEVHLRCPDELQEGHNSYPLTTKIKVTKN